MRPRHIERTIHDKVQDWLSSITDEKLRKYLSDKVIVMGGAITSMLLGERPNDYDVYLKTKEAVKRVAKYYVAQFKEKETNLVKFHGAEKCADIKVVERDGRIQIMVKSAGVAAEGGRSDYRYFEMNANPNDEANQVEGFIHGSVQQAEEADVGELDLPPYRPVFLTSNAITLTDDVQIVIRFHGKPSEIHATYDFEHCKNYWCSWLDFGSKLTILKSALLATINKQLIYTGSKYPLCSLFRLRKFHKRGWYYQLGEVLKIAFNLREFDLTDPKILEDQLAGVDAAYFSEIIRKIREDGMDKVDGTYIATLVDSLY